MFSLNLFIYIVDWETSYCILTIIKSLSTLQSSRVALVAALAYSFSKSTRESLMCSGYCSPLIRASLLSSPSDGLASFRETILTKCLVSY